MVRLTGHRAIRCVAALFDHGRLSIDDIISFLATEGASTEWDAHGVIRDVAPRLTVDELRRVADVARARGLGVGALTEQMLDRGAWETALRYQPSDPWILFALLPAAMAGDDEDGRRAWIGRATAVLESILDDEIAAARDPQRDPCDTGTLVLLRGAVHLTAHLPASTRQRLLDHLEAQVASESEAGCYDLLDYPYGTPDPALELAHVLAVGGEPGRAAALLSERHARQPQFLNDEEIAEATRALAAFDAGRREVWWPTLRRWARTSDAGGNLGFHLCEVRWLLGVLPPSQLEQHLGEMIGRDLGANALREILGDPRLSVALRARSREALVECLTADAEGLNERDDYQVMRHRIAFRAGATAAAAVAPDLTPPQHDAIAHAARRWSRWVTEPRNASTDELSVAVALATHWRAEIEPALPSLCATYWEVLATHPGWETLLSPDEVERHLTRLLP